MPSFAVRCAGIASFFQQAICDEPKKAHIDRSIWALIFGRSLVLNAPLPYDGWSAFPGNGTAG